MRTLIKCLTALGCTFFVAALLDATAKREHERKMAELELEREKMARSLARDLNLGFFPPVELERTVASNEKGELIAHYNTGQVTNMTTGEDLTPRPDQQEKPRSLLEPAWKPSQPFKPGKGRKPESFA